MVFDVTLMCSRTQHGGAGADVAHTLGKLPNPQR